MNYDNKFLGDFHLYSDWYHIISCVQDMGKVGYRLIFHKQLDDDMFFLMFRTFAFTKVSEKPIILRDRAIMELRERLYLFSDFFGHEK